MSEQDSNDKTGEQNTGDDSKAPEVKAGDVKGLPQWAQDLISQVRGEAANYRTQLRESQSALEKAKTPEDIEKATTELREANARLERDLLIERVAAKHGLPEDLKGRLKGDNEKDLETDAAALAKFVPKVEVKVDPENLSGGLNPDDSTDNFDPVAVAKAARTTRY